MSLITFNPGLGLGLGLLLVVVLATVLERNRR